MPKPYSYGRYFSVRHRFALRGTLLIRHRVKDAQPHANGQVRILAAHALNDGLQQPRASGKVAAKRSWPAARAEEFVQQIPMARFDVDKLKPHFARHTGAHHVVVDQLFQFGVRQDHRGIPGIDAEFRIEQRMMERNAWLQLPGLGPRKPSGVSELQADHEIIRAAKPSAVRVAQLLQELLQARAVAGCRQRLMRVGPTIRLYRRRLATPHQLRAAAPDVLPAPQGQFAGGPVGIGVPAFHGMDAPAVTDGVRSQLDRGGQGRRLPGRQDLVVHGQFQPQLNQAITQRCGRLELGDLHVAVTHGAAALDDE